MSRSTPETDALRWHYREYEPFTNVPVFNLAEKLEQERDEARELARELRDGLAYVLHLTATANHPSKSMGLAVNALTKAKEVLDSE